MTRRLSLVLHTHMPYVEGFGTWPFGEEWLFEAMATCYLPLSEILDDRVTLSVTPVLADQLEAPGLQERFQAFLRDVREESHALDIAAHPEVAAQLEHSLARYRRARDKPVRLSPTWTSSATHAILPLLATEWGIDLQVRTGVESHRARFGEPAGFWLPECAHAPWVLPHLTGITCVELPFQGAQAPWNGWRSGAGAAGPGADRSGVGAGRLPVGRGVPGYAALHRAAASRVVGGGGAV